MLLYPTKMEERLNTLRVWTEEEIRSVHNRMATLEDRIRILEGEVSSLKSK